MCGCCCTWDLPWCLEEPDSKTKSDWVTLTGRYAWAYTQTNLLNNQSSETVSDENDFGRQTLLISLDQQGSVQVKNGRTKCRPRFMSNKFSRVLAWSLTLAVDIVHGFAMFALYPYTDTREYGISSARKSLGQNFPLSWVQVLNGWSFRPCAFRP